MRITGAKVYDSRHGFVERDICTDGNMISATSGDDIVIEAKGCYIIPGLTDVHFHGCKGHDFSDGDAEGLEVMAKYELSRGVTQICPAGMTLLEDQLEKICAVAANHRKEGRPGASLCGIQLEGPFLSYEKRGAQNGDWLHSVDKDLLHHLMEVSGGLIKIVAVAPELDNALDFIKDVSEEVTVSVAHTTADYDLAAKAFEAGARQVTHLFNAMPAYSHRAPGVVGAAMDAPDCMVELICDGVHIHPAVVRGVFRMFGHKRVILVSDSIRATGMPDGEYTLGGQDVIVNGRLATLKSGTIAGSATDLMACLETAVSMGIPLEHAVRAAAVNPAKAIGIYSRVGSLEDGKLANIAILNGDCTLKQVIFRGELVTE